MKDCCRHNKKTRKCIRKKDKKVFNLPRRFTKKRCLDGPIKGFTMKSSCAPYKYCKKEFDVYVDANPKDTISIKYTTVKDVEDTIRKLKKLHKNKTYSHKRIWQVAMIMKVRLEAIKKNHPQVKHINKRVKLAQNYFKSLRKKTRKN